MNTRESMRFAVQGVTANKTRSALTTLGIMIGVAAVIVLVAVGTGSSKAVADSISGLGASTLTVSSTSTAAGGRAGGFAGPFGGGGAATSTTSGTKTDSNELTMDDARALTDTTLAPDVEGVAPVVSAQSVTATYEGASHSVGTFTGTTSAYLLINNDTVSSGTPFTDDDYTEHRRVALVGTTVAEDLAGGDGSTILDKTVSLQRQGLHSRRDPDREGLDRTTGLRRPGDRPRHRRAGHPVGIRRPELHLREGHLPGHLR